MTRRSFLSLGAAAVLMPRLPAFPAPPAPVCDCGPWMPPGHDHYHDCPCSEGWKP